MPGRFPLAQECAVSSTPIEIFSDAVDRGFFPFETFTRHAWLDPLRHRQDFNVVLQRAEHRHLQARAAFVEAGGETLLGGGS
jgi:hypothetical protein